MIGRRGRIPSRSRIYLGCEGASEVGYGQRILDLAGDAGLHIHIDTDDLGMRGGTPRSRIEIAIQRIRKKESTRNSFAHRAVLIDFDQIDNNQQELSRVSRMAQEEGIQIIWQRPCHEALLLRHLSGCDDRRPPTTALAEAQLKIEWPEYRKPMNRARLAHRIGTAELRRAANVEPELSAFLNAIRFIR